MSLKLKLGNLKEWLETPEGKKSIDKYCAQLVFKDNLRKKHGDKIKSMFTDQASFDKIIESIIAKHDDKWDDTCRKNGYETSPLNLLYSVYELAESEGTELNKGFDSLTINWPTSIYEYMNWQFCITQGQGAVMSIYHNNELKLRI